MEFTAEGWRVSAWIGCELSNVSYDKNSDGTSLTMLRCKIWIWWYVNRVAKMIFLRPLHYEEWCNWTAWLITEKQVNQNLLEEKEKHQISDSSPQNISQCLPKYPLQQGPERVLVREKDFPQFTCLLVQVFLRSSLCRFDLTQEAPWCRGVSRSSRRRGAGRPTQ